MRRSGRHAEPDQCQRIEQERADPIRAFKKEAELEIWKLKADGRYAYLKTFPMCRWSGQLGPKVREGDRQVPEGFYAITPGSMNPNSAYYLSFNVGYPNAYDRAWGHTGGAIMVHGICSSAGCFSMTDKQIEEIYAITREAFAGGQRAVQMESFPFRMTAENLAKYRLGPQHRLLARTQARIGLFRDHQDRAAGRRLRQALRVRHAQERTAFRCRIGLPAAQRAAGDRLGHRREERQGRCRDRDPDRQGRPARAYRLCGRRTEPGVHAPVRRRLAPRRPGGGPDRDRARRQPEGQARRGPDRRRQGRGGPAPGGRSETSPEHDHRGWDGQAGRPRGDRGGRSCLPGGPLGLCQGRAEKHDPCPSSTR